LRIAGAVPSSTMALQAATEAKFGEKLANDTFFKHATALKPKAPRHLAAKLAAIEDNNPTPVDDVVHEGSRRGGQRRSVNEFHGLRISRFHGTYMQIGACTESGAGETSGEFGRGEGASVVGGEARHEERSEEGEADGHEDHVRRLKCCCV